MTKEDFKHFLKTVLPVAFVIGLIFGLYFDNLHQNEIIEQLEDDLSETREQLLITNDQLKQIQMYQEREQYMEDE